MRQTAFIVILLISIIVPLAPIMAQETPSASQELIYTPPSLPSSPLDFLLGGDQIKDKAQNLMEQAQQGIQQGTSQAVGQAQQAAQNEISRQAEAQTQKLKKEIQNTIERVRNFIGAKIQELKTNIKNILNNLKQSLFNRPATY